MECWCDYDPPEFWRSAIRKARKAARCEECGGSIPPGASYEYVVGKWEGFVDTFRTCERCHDLRVWVKNSLPCFCWAHGNMIDDAKEAVKEAGWRAPDEMRGVAFGFGRRLVAIQRAGGSV